MLLLLQLCTEDAPTLWLSTQADNILKAEDMHSLAYFWDTLKLDKVGEISAGKKWNVAADLALWCLQGNPARRPHNMEDVLAHKLFAPGGTLRFLHSMDESMVAFEIRQARALTSAINSRDSATVRKLFSDGAVHLKMLDTSISGSTVSVFMRSAFVGDSAVTEILLDEIDDSWPEQVRQEYLDSRTSLGFTAYMIACACGHEKVAKLFEAKGCSKGLANDFGQTGAALLQGIQGEHGRSLNMPLHHTCDSLESYLALFDRKAIVMSCPEFGTLDWNGGPPYTQHVMDKVNELRQRGKLHGGFDRAGSSNTDPRDQEIWPKIFKTKGKQSLYETNDTNRRDLIKSTYWFTGYRSAVKAQMILECQTFGGTLDVICIQGGPITDVEHEEMEAIVQEAICDAAKNKIQTNIQLKKVSYNDFLLEYDPRSFAFETRKQMQELPLEPQEDPLRAPATHGDVVGSADARRDVAQLVAKNKELTAKNKELAANAQQLAAKEQELVAKEQELVAHAQQLATNAKELAAKDQELEQLRGQLARLGVEGIPPS
eukprot:SAG25_NODE_112_length_14924_cov_13.606476_6_plen_544_part_00